jgi:hypothetical protein
VKSLMITPLFLIFLGADAQSTISNQTSNQMTHFNYSSCSENSCVVLKAPKAYMGLDLQNFVTSGVTTLELTDRKGQITSTYVGESVSFNPKLNVLVLETKTDGFMIYSLKDGSLTDFRAKVGSK